MRTWLAAPARFTAAGALLFIAARWWAPGPASLPVEVASTAGDRSDDALLLRAAYAAGLSHSRTVRGRLVNLAQSLGLADESDTNDLEREARAIALDQSDPVVRRHLVDLMTLAASAPPLSERPDEAALRAYYAAHADAYAIPERVQLTHVYFSRARRGASATADAAAALVELRGGSAAAGGLGDGFSRGSVVGPATRDEISRELGATFADAVFALPDGVWSGPLDSTYGIHLVHIDARRPASLPAFESVRGRVLHSYLRERGAQHLQDTLALLRQR